MRRLRPILAALVATVAALASAADASLTTELGMRASDARSGLRTAGIELLTGDEAAAAAEVREAREAYADGLQEPIDGADATADRDAQAALDEAEDAARDGDVRALAAARGTFAAAVLRGSAAVTLSATDRGEAAVARRWLLLRDFRTATRFTRPGADATLAIERLGEARLGREGGQTG